VPSAENVKPPPVLDCRVLELGCNDGSNLLAMALSLPNNAAATSEGAA